ncbi:MAG: type II toxin-antitoxin system VapC family toxin [Lacipirellulaceae bacterium]
MVFVDTSAWYAAWNPREPEHLAARARIVAASGRLVTTDYVVDELLTLMVSRGQGRIAIAAGHDLWSATTADLHLVTAEDLERAWSVFQRFTDKRWSFTDCTSYAVMQHLGVREALSLDDHFRQFGFVSVEP